MQAVTQETSSPQFDVSFFLHVQNRSCIQSHILRAVAMIDMTEPTDVLADLLLRGDSKKLARLEL